MRKKHMTKIERRNRTRDFLLSIVIPCFNEEEVISATYHRIIDVFGSKEYRLQLIFVDDGSIDRTSEILKEIAVADSRVKVMTLSRNFGHQAAVSAGLVHASGDATAIIDADLQDPPEVIQEMIAKWLDGFDVVYGIRTKRKEAKWKRLSYTLFYRIFSVIASIDAPLDAGDFSLIDRRVLEVINQLPEKNRFFRGLRAWIGFAQIGIPYERASRAAGTTKYSFFKLLKLASDGIFNFSTIPLTMVFYLGFVVSSFSFMALIFVVIWRVAQFRIFGMSAGDVQGFASIAVFILFIGGVQLICTGILGEYIGRIYQEVKGRPYFVARSSSSSTASTASGVSEGQEKFLERRPFEGQNPAKVEEQVA